MPPPMSKADQEKLSKIPEFKMLEINRSRSLPSVVDNSTFIYFRPLIAQVGLECGQSSSIGIMFIVKRFQLLTAQSAFRLQINSPNLVFTR